MAAATAAGKEMAPTRPQHLRGQTRQPALRQKARQSQHVLLAIHQAASHQQSATGLPEIDQSRRDS